MAKKSQNIVSLPSVSPEEAFLTYYGMGYGRSLSSLRTELIAKDGASPSVPTLERWCKQGEWVQRCTDMEQEAAEKAREATVTKRAEFTSGMVAQYQEIGGLTVEAAKKHVRKLAEKEDLSPKEVSMLLDMSIEATNMAVALEGHLEEHARLQSSRTGEEVAADTSSLMAEVRNALRKRHQPLLSERTKQGKRPDTKNPPTGEQ